MSLDSDRIHWCRLNTGVKRDPSNDVARKPNSRILSL